MIKKTGSIRSAADSISRTWDLWQFDQVHQPHASVQSQPTPRRILAIDGALKIFEVESTRRRDQEA